MEGIGHYMTLVTFTPTVDANKKGHQLITNKNFFFFPVRVYEKSCKNGSLIYKILIQFQLLTLLRIPE